MKVDVLLGLQWGDEGKGKIVDVLTPKYDIIARFQGGPNAGHTLIFDGKKHVLHTIPSGVFRPGTKNVVGNGVVIDPVIFKREITQLLEAGVDPRPDLLISRRAHLITPTHRLLDAASEQAKGKAKIGSTLKGIGPTYMDKTGRNGLRVGDLTSGKFNERYQALRKKHLGLLQQFPDFEFDLESVETEWMEAAMELGQLQLIDTEHYLNEALDAGKRVLAEGAQGTMLDIDFGTYPFVTSSNTIAAGACNGLGVGPGRIGEVIGIFKAYCTRVGSGPFPTELLDATGEALRQAGGEFGATTGRPRRCGWLDLVQLHYACRVNGVTQLAMMKADVLSGFDEIPVCHSYQYDGATTQNLPYGIEPDEVTPDYKNHGGWLEDLTGATTEAALPESLTNYIAMVEKEMATPISIVSVGPDRAQTIER
ncbi:adenylosuccinate synthase [Flavobacteriales bacterium]|nr:adenylosuccinate synthase [Flavobacteriales bacterium]